MKDPDFVIKVEKAIQRNMAMKQFRIRKLLGIMKKKKYILSK